MFPFRYTQIHPKVTILRELHRFAGPAAAPLALILAGFGFIGSQSVFAQKAIVPNGNTQTSVSTTGAVTNVITNTIRGDNAYNSFSTFNVNQGNTVNLFLPTGTDNLLNLVNSQTSAINGVLNSIKNGKIGGNLFFADPYGFIIGKTGSVNAGSFLAVTPTPAFMNQFFTAPGVPSPNAAASLLNGTVPITPDGLISVQGKINAAQSIGLFAGKVTNSGTIASGAVFSGAKPDFSDVVNVAGLQTGSAISVQNGTVEIQAAGDFENSGTISTNGANNLNAGNIDIHGNNVKLDPNSLISARGEGQKSNGGKVTIFADKNSELDSNAVVTAAGGDVSGNGGSIDFSAKDTASLNGGVLKAGAAHGIAGSVTIDPTDLNVTANDTPNDGSNLSFSGDTITVAPSVVISSRQIGSGTDFLNSPSTGNSGSITFTANSTAETPSITIGNGAEILAHATGQYTPGDITFTASQTNNASQAVAAANINIGNALIQGGNINISATAQATADSSANPAVANSNFVDTKLNLVNGAVAENTSSATSGITIGDSNSGNAQITASGTLAINSTATSSTTSKLSSTIGLAYGESDSTATATIGKTAVLNAGGALSVNANSKNTLNVKETISQNSTDVAAFAYGNASSNSSAEVDGSVTGGSVQIGATNTNSFSTNASATDYGTQATSAAGAGIALGFYQSNANTNLTGSATSTGGDVQIASATTNSANTTRSSSSLPSQGIKAQIAKGQNWTQSLDGSSGLLSKIASGQTKFGSAPAVASQANSTNLGLTAAVSIAESGNSATTTVSGNVTSQGGKVNVSSQATDNPQISAAGSVGGENADLGGAVAVSDFHNTADTYVNGNAAIMGAGAVSITAEADILNPASQSADQVASGFTGIDSASDLANDTNLKNLVSSITTALQGAADPGAFTTSYVNTGMSTAGDSSGGFGIGGAVNLLGLTNQSVASVTGSAKVTANAGDLSVNATSKAALINAAGMGLVPGQIAMANPGVKAGTSVGGSYNGVNLSNTSTAYIGDGTTATASQGNVNVNATTNTFVINLAQAGDKATQFGITGTFDDGNLTDNAEAYIQSNATVSAGQGVNVSATNPLTDIAVGGALGIGGSGQVGVAVNWNQINDTTLAYIGDPSNPLTSASGKVTGSNVNLTASSTEDVYGITFAATKSGNSGKGADGESTSPPTDAKTADSAPTSGGDEVKGESGDNGAGGGQYGFGISGEIAFNQITNGSGPGVTTEAFINNGANVTATNGNISPTATDTLFAVAGGLAGTVGQTNALAGAYSQNTFDKQVQAFTGNATVNGNGLNIQAISNGSLFDVTAGGAINTESGTALAGSVNNNSITNTVSASLGTGTNAASIGGNGITVNASEGSNGDQVLSVAGGFGISVGEAGVGAAVDYGNYTNNVSSSIGGTSVGTTGNVQVTSSTNVNYLPIAASLAVGSDFGAAGSAAVDQISDTTTSTADGTVTARGNLVIASNDSSSALIVGGGVGISGDTGVGVTAVIPQFSRTTESLIANSAHVSAQGNGSPISYDGQNVTGMLLDAKTTGNLQDYSVAGSASGEASIAGAVILNPFYASNPNSLKDDTEANIGSSAVVNGSNNGAAGQSVSLIASDTSGIQDAAGMLAIGGDLGAGVGFDVVSPSWTVNTSIGSGATVNAAKNVVTASNLQNSINSYAVSGAGSGEAAAAGAATLINETSNTTANIDGTVAAGGNVDVSAIRNTSKLNSLDGNAAVALNIGVGFGISASDITTNDTVDASLGGAANVTALGNGGSINVPNGQLDSNGNPVTASFQGLSVTAMSHGSVNPIAAGGAGSGGISVDGSAPVNNLTETTQAHIDSGAAVNTNNSGANSNESVQTLATDDTNLNSIAGTLSVGLGSLAAALDFDTVNRTVTANISGASVKAADNALIGALTEGSLQSTAASGSVGGFSGAGAASTVNETTNTNAYIDGGSNVSANNNVAVAANRNTSLTIHDGGAAFGALDGLAASVANVNQSNTVQAYVGDSSGSTTSVTALGQGSGISAPVDSSGNPAAGTVSGLSVTAQGTETLQMIAAGGAIGSGVGLSGSILTNSFTENTSAKIDSSASINSNNAGAGSSQGVNLLASDTTNLTAGAGALGGAANGVGIGVGVDAENIHKTTTAGIDNGANLKTNAAINVDALSKETINSYTAAIGVGVGGAAGTSADYQTHPIDPTTTADISGATINSGSLGVNANDNLSLTAKTGEVSAGGVALGAATALVNANANTSASVSGGSITLSPNGALSV
ncbi:MAG TPA: leukotoxin LktA family filamentous adhesin, partial [Bryobacteraceae bacterium]|nr:leukotoxin LktA family filamentous adhesin [Bryobacteraceae bacterium]